MIYDNNPTSFNNDLKVLEKSLPFDKISDEDYKLNFTARIPFKKGLYYMLLRKENNGEMIHLQRFYVR